VLGDAVRAFHEEDQEWYEGTVEGVLGDGSYRVKMDVPNSGPEVRDLPKSRVKGLDAYREYQEGEKVYFYLDDRDEEPEVGTVVEIQPRGWYTVSYDDPVEGPSETILHAKELRSSTASFHLRQKCPGVVIEVREDDALVDVGAAEPGVLRLAQVPGYYFRDGKFALGVGQQVEVWVVGNADRLEVRLWDPWALRKFQTRADDKTKELRGRVLQVGGFGALVQVTKRVEGVRFFAVGLIDQSLLEGEDLAEGQQVRVEATFVDLRRGEMRLAPIADGAADEAPATDPGTSPGRVQFKLSPRRVERLTAFTDISKDTWLNGEVISIFDYGAFVRVTLENGAMATGLLHKSGLQEGRIQNVADFLSVGQALRVRIKNIDLVKNNLEFTMYDYQPTSQSDLRAFATLAKDVWLKGKVVKLVKFGAFVSAELNGVRADGLVHVRNIKRGFIPTPESELYVGQEVNVRVEYVDLQKGKMGLTMI